MDPMTPAAGDRGIPAVARRLGYAGLLPQLGVVVILIAQNNYWRFAALALGYAYAALILSFLGGVWWGIAAQHRHPAPAWVLWAAVAPPLIAPATAVPWAIGAPWPGPSMVVLGIALIGSLAVDARLATGGMTPCWWMTLRAPLSIGLGLLTLSVVFL